MKSFIVLFSIFATATGAVALAPALRPAPKTTRPALAPEPAAAAPVAADPNAATPIPEGEAPEKTIARFFGYLQRKEVDLAYDQLTRGTKIADRKEDVKMLKSKTTDALAVFGAMTGYDAVAKKAVGERLMSYTFISLGKEFPLRWRFYFYKPQDAWKLIDLRVDDRLSAMFDEPEPASASREP
jgi:hypothetical protein